MSQLAKEGTCIIHGTEKGKTCALKVTNEKWYNSMFTTIVCCKQKIN